VLLLQPPEGRGNGVMRAPAGVDEDTRSGFGHGGWPVPYGDDGMANSVGPGMGSTQGGEDGGLLLGRTTYEHFYSVWPGRTDGNPFTDRLNAARKYVASNTLAIHCPWKTPP
jgi:dihydrofolate reductase